MTRYTKRNLVFTGVVVVVAALVCLGVFLNRTPRRQFTIKTYFANGQNLRSGAEVWIDGIRAGTVTVISIHLEQNQHPVEVIMAITKPFEAAIPVDSTAMLSSQGVLAPVGIEIDTRGAEGPLIHDGGILKSLEVSDSEARKATDRIGEILLQTVKEAHKK